MSTLTTSMALGDRRTLPRLAGLPLAATVLGAVALLSIAVGAKGIPLGDVMSALLEDDGSESAAIVRELRVPRTLVGLAVGIGLGLAGALMQALTRNPLADPGILGVEAGAAAAIVTAIGLLGITQPRGYIWFSFLGAAVASIVVYLLGSHGRRGRGRGGPGLAGAAGTCALAAYTNGITRLAPEAFAGYRHWVVGSLAGRDMQILSEVGPFLVVGVLIALTLARPLNALALG